MHIFMFTDRKNNRFQKKLIVQNTNIYIYIYIYISSSLIELAVPLGGGEISCAFMG